jgi:hypothetical protein
VDRARRLDQQRLVAIVQQPHLQDDLAVEDFGDVGHRAGVRACAAGSSVGCCLRRTVRTGRRGSQPTGRPRRTGVCGAARWDAPRAAGAQGVGHPAQQRRVPPGRRPRRRGRGLRGRTRRDDKLTRRAVGSQRRRDAAPGLQRTQHTVRAVRDNRNARPACGTRVTARRLSARVIVPSLRKRTARQQPVPCTGYRNGPVTADTARPAVLSRTPAPGLPVAMSAARGAAGGSPARVPHPAAAFGHDAPSASAASLRAASTPTPGGTTSAGLPSTEGVRGLPGSAAGQPPAAAPAPAATGPQALPPPPPHSSTFASHPFAAKTFPSDILCPDKPARHSFVRGWD